MTVVTEKFVTVSDKTPKGKEIKISGSVGKFTVSLDNRDIVFYTSELESLRNCLGEFEKRINEIKVQ